MMTLVARAVWRQLNLLASISVDHFEAQFNPASVKGVGFSFLSKLSCYNFEVEKDFDNWNIKKKITHRENKRVMFYEREVWWCITGINVGVEIDGKHELFLRPVIIVRKFNKDMALAVPTTAQDKNNKYYFLTSGEDRKTYNACLSQIRTISSKRLFRKIGTIRAEDYNVLLEKVAQMVKGDL